MAKKTKITLHVNTGEKKENGKNKQLHIVLWNREDAQDQFHGGVAEVQEINGKKTLASVKKDVEINGKTYQNDAEPLTLFVNRAKTTNRIMSLAIMKDRVQVGEIKFKKEFSEKNVVLSGTFNAAGLKFDDQYRVVAGQEGNRSITGEIVGGLRDEVLGVMIPSKPKAKAQKAAA